MRPKMAKIAKMADCLLADWLLLPFKFVKFSDVGLLQEITHAVIIKRKGRKKELCPSHKDIGLLSDRGCLYNRAYPVQQY